MIAHQTHGYMLQSGANSVGVHGIRMDHTNHKNGELTDLVHERIEPRQASAVAEAIEVVAASAPLMMRGTTRSRSETLQRATTF